MKRTHPRHAAVTERALAAYTAVRGMRSTFERADQIAELPRKLWRGRPVYRLICDADFGRGPHEVWVPEYVLWSIIAFEAFRCPFHR